MKHICESCDTVVTDITQNPVTVFRNGVGIDLCVECAFPELVYDPCEVCPN